MILSTGSTNSVLLGLDFDNTLISYDLLFHRIARQKGLIPSKIPKEKTAIRNYLRANDIEVEWTRLQGEVYGAHILEAEPFPEMLATLRNLATQDISMCLVSHKTRVPYMGPAYDLHAAARGWLTQWGFFSSQGLGWTDDQIFFEITKEEKIERIVSLGCTHYVDDLPEILELLPPSVEKILFAPGLPADPQADWKHMSSWSDLSYILRCQ